MAGPSTNRQAAGANRAETGPEANRAGTGPDSNPAGAGSDSNRTGTAPNTIPAGAGPTTDPTATGPDITPARTAAPDTNQTDPGPTTTRTGTRPNTNPTATAPDTTPAPTAPDTNRIDAAPDTNRTDAAPTTTPPPTAPVTNWAGNIRFRASRRAAPGCVDDVRELVAASRTVRVLGTGHSFNDLADTTGLLLATSALPKSVEIDARAGTVTVGAGVRFGELTGVLHASGHALHNLGSLPHISVAGACATGTHGAGVGNPSLAAAVRALELVTADGELLTLDRSDERFPGSVVALGALGVVTRVTLGLVPAFDVRQWVYEGLPTAALRDGLDEVLSAAYSVSLFTRWRGERVEQVWLKQRVDGAAPVCLPGARLADGPRHPVPGMAPEACTPQGGVPGPWHTRLPHFRLEHIPSSGAETQSEYFVARSDASAAFAALDRVREEFAPVLRIGEVRAVAADDLWLSPAHRRDSVAFHFTWLPDAPAVAQALHHVERALAPFAPRPHWGKVFVTPPETLRERYEHHDRFRRLMTALDPAGKFRNDFLRRHFPEA